MSIRARLLILLLLTAILPAGLVGWRYYQDRQEDIGIAVNELMAIARTVASNLEAKVQGTAQLHFGLARARDLINHDKEGCSRFLSEVLARNPQYTGILTIDPDGSLFCDSLRTGRTLDLRDRDYFKRAISTVGASVLEPAFGRLTQSAVLQIAFAARDAMERTQFVLLASLDLQMFVREQAENLPRGVEILLVDSHGTVMGRSPERLPGPGLGTSIENSSLFRFAQHNIGETQELVAESGDRQVWAAADSATLAWTGLHVLVARSKTELVAAPNQRLVQDLTLLGVLSLLIFAAVWLLVEFGIRSQIGRIATMAERLGAGDLGARILAPFPSGELGGLMAVLNGTAASLERQRSDIDELNKKLRQSQRLEAIGHLTGGVAHDFNNLLTVILGNAELLEENLSRDPKLLPLAQMTMAAAESGAALTSRLLSFSRQQALDPKAADINSLVARMDGMLRRTLGADIDIRMVAAENLWHALVDATELENAMLNLGINARDAMPDGGRLTLETANVHLDGYAADRTSDVVPGDYVMITVSDTGTGMDKETLSQAFEPFFTTKGVGKGSGLGLSMVYGFVKQSKGHIQIYSERGHGTAIKLYLPRADETAERYADADTGNAPMPRGTERILLVEDDDRVRAQVSAQLGKLGYRVVCVENGPEALAAIKTGDNFDLLFTDVIMPGGLTGRQLADEACRLFPRMHVLFTSGYSENAIVHHGRLDRGVHLLNKPYRMKELAIKVRAALDENDVRVRQLAVS